MSFPLSVAARLRRGDFALDVAFDAPAGSITALFGPSGSGKSLTLSATAGLASLTSGRITLGERVLEDTDARVRMPAHLRGIGLVFQDARLLPHLSVRKNLAFALKRAPPGAASISCADAAASVGIEDLLDRPVHNLSGGEKSRVALARALVSAPECLLLDEPFAALDGVARRAFLSMLRETNRNRALPMLVVTHQVDDVASLADHVVAMRAGRVEASGSPMVVAQSAAFQAALDARDSGAPVRVGDAVVWVRADNVLLARVAPTGLSARYVWPGRIKAMAFEAERSVLVTVRTENGVLFARITVDAANELQLSCGDATWAVVKAHAL